MRVVLMNGVNPGVNYIGRRIEIRLADFQMDNAPALGLKRARFGQGFKCGFSSQAGHTLGQPQFC